MPRVDFATEIPQSAHEAAYGLGPVARGEVLGAEVVIRHAVAEQVIARHRAHVSPGRADQRRLELGCAITHAGGAALLPGTPVVCRDKGRPATGDRLPRAPPWKCTSSETSACTADRVNERLETSAAGVWAIGECAGSP